MIHQIPNAARRLKRVCICEDDTLPVIIKINPCPGRTCPYARESLPLLVSQESSISVISFSESEEDEEEEVEETPSPTEKIDSATSTTQGRTSTGTEVFDDFHLVPCEAFNKGGKCVNDAQCATSPSLHKVPTAKIVAHKANQIICTHTNLTFEEKEKNLEETMMRGLSQIVVAAKSQESLEEDLKGTRASRISSRFGDLK